MKREKNISDLSNHSGDWDIAIIGGGATGVGTAVEAASRGYKVILVEQSDFGKGTSSRSTKLVHGGVRYLQQGNITLVLEALKERGIMRRNAPHLVHDMPFVVPVYDWWEGPFYGIGLKIYDMLAGKEGFGPSKYLSKDETVKYLPTIETEGLKGGVIYHDGQFDDARLLINLVQTASEHGATLINYMKVISLNKDNDEITGLSIVDTETDLEYAIKAKVIINATGVFCDSVRKMDDNAAKNIITSSQGVHIVLDKSFLPGNTAIMVPHTDDGRVIFAVPWYDTTVVGTTDTPVKDYPLEPIPLESEIEFLLKHSARYLSKDPTRKDVKSVFAGLRPLVRSNKNDDDTASISRDHTITISRSGLISISGGKWTTYRKMAEDVIEQAIIVGDLPDSESISKTLQIHAYHNNPKNLGSLSTYGSDAYEIKDMLKDNNELKGKIHPDHNILIVELVWAIRHEMARNIDDFLARRSRLLILDAKASIEIAPIVAKIMAKELDRDEKWEKNQVDLYKGIAKNYLIS